MRKDIVLSWSGGKDSARAYYEILKSGEYNISCLLVSFNGSNDRISMHGVRKDLVRAQAAALDVGLIEVDIYSEEGNDGYERRMSDVLSKLKDDGIETIAFGDIFLQDVRDYREKNLSKVGMKAFFPLWGLSSRNLAFEFSDLGFKSVLTCVDTLVLDESFLGSEFDHLLLSKLPEKVDFSGERGEFHTFVFDGPIFGRSINFKFGNKHISDSRFAFIDLTSAI